MIDYTALFDALPTSSLLIKANAPLYTIVAASPLHLKDGGVRKEDIIGKSLFEAYPTNPGNPGDTGETNMRESFEYVARNKKPHRLPVQRYDVVDDQGVFIERYWQAENKPVFSDDSEVAFILQTTQELTAQIKAEKRESQLEQINKASEEKYRGLFNSINDGSTIIELILDETGRLNDIYHIEANESYKRLTGLDVDGKRLREFMPDVEQKWLDFYEKVALTGMAESVDYVESLKRWYRCSASRIGQEGSLQVAVIFSDVTEQIDIRKRLEESEENVRRLFMQAPAVICILRGPQLVHELANERYMQFIGNRDAIGRSIKEVLPEVEGQGYFELLENVYATGEPYFGNEMLVMLDNGGGTLEESYFNLVYQPTHNSEGEIDGILVHGVNVTEQILIRKKIEVSEEKYHSLFNSIHDAFCIIEMIFDEKGKPVDWIYVETNPAFLQHATVEMKGKRISEIVPEMEVFWLEKYGGVAQTGEPVQLEHIVKGLGDQWFQTSAFRHGPKGSNRVAILFRNITERKAAEEKLKESETRFRNVLLDSPNLFVILEGLPEMIITFANEPVFKSWGRTAEIIGKPLLEALPELKEQSFPTLLQRVFETGETYYSGEEKAVLIKDGIPADTYFEYVYQAILDDNRKVTGVTVMATDITKQVVSRKESEESEKRQAYLLKLSDGLREITDPLEIQRVACRILGEQLQASRVVYGDVIEEQKVIISNNYVNGVAPIIATLNHEEFGLDLIATYKLNKKFLISDVRIDARFTSLEKQKFASFEVVAHASMGLVRGGRWVAIFGVHQNVPRIWTVSELLMMQETAERTWAAVERAKAEVALQKSEEKYRTLFTSIDQGFALCELVRNKEGKGIDFYVLEVNPTYEKQTGVSMEMMVPGKTILEILPTLDKWWVDTYAAMVDSQNPAVFEKYFENTQLWFEINTYPGEKDRFAILFSDITERKNEEHRKEYLLKLSDALQELTDPVEIQTASCRILGEHLNISRVLYGDVTNEDQVIILANYVNGVPPIIGTFNAVEFGQPVIDGFKRNEKIIFSDIDTDPDYSEEAKQRFHSINVVANVGMGLLKGGRWVASLSMHNNAPKKWTPSEILLLEETAERTWAAVERAKAEEALRQSEEQYRSKLESEVKQRTAELNETNTSLRYANENLQQFASIASHDLQEPLRKLKLFASVLQRYENELPEEAKAVIQKISLTSVRMRQLITEVLQYSKIAYGSKTLVPTNLDSILKNVLSDLDLLLADTEASIQYIEPLPEIAAVPFQMNQLFYNLLTNALKFRKKIEKPVIDISYRIMPNNESSAYLELHADKPYIEIKFSDNGIGFPQEYAEQIFQLFERLFSTDEYEGTGVGLALCKKIAENHNGHIYAASTDGEGATFYILLPVSQKKA